MYMYNCIVRAVCPAHSEPSHSQRVKTTLRNNTAMFLTPCSNTFVNPLPHPHDKQHYRHVAAPFISRLTITRQLSPPSPGSFYCVFPWACRTLYLAPRNNGIGRGTIIVPVILSICARANNNQIIVVYSSNNNNSNRWLIGLTRILHTRSCTCSASTYKHTT